MRKVSTQFLIILVTIVVASSIVNAQVFEATYDANGQSLGALETLRRVATFLAIPTEAMVLDVSASSSTLATFYIIHEALGYPGGGVATTSRDQAATLLRQIVASESNSPSAQFAMSFFGFSSMKITAATQSLAPSIASLPPSPSLSARWHPQGMMPGTRRFFKIWINWEFHLRSTTDAFVEQRLRNFSYFFTGVPNSLVPYNHEAHRTKIAIIFNANSNPSENEGGSGVYRRSTVEQAILSVSTEQIKYFLGALNFTVWTSSPSNNNQSTSAPSTMTPADVTAAPIAANNRTLMQTALPPSWTTNGELQYCAECTGCTLSGTNPGFAQRDALQHSFALLAKGSIGSLKDIQKQTLISSVALGRNSSFSCVNVVVPPTALLASCVAQWSGAQPPGPGLPGEGPEFPLFWISTAVTVVISIVTIVVVSRRDCGPLDNEIIRTRLAILAEELEEEERGGQTHLMERMLQEGENGDDDHVGVRSHTRRTGEDAEGFGADNDSMPQVRVDLADALGGDDEHHQGRPSAASSKPPRHENFYPTSQEMRVVEDAMGSQQQPQISARGSRRRKSFTTHDENDPFATAPSGDGLSAPVSARGTSASRSGLLPGEPDHNASPFDQQAVVTPRQPVSARGPQSRSLLVEEDVADAFAMDQ